MAIGTRTYGSGGGASAAATFTISYPAGIQAGDLLIVACYTRSNNASAFTIPDGWDGTVKAVTASANGSYAVYYKIAAGTESGTFTINGSTSNNTEVAKCVSIPGAAASFTQGAAEDEAAGLTFTNAGVTPPSNGCLVVLVTGFQDHGTGNNDTGFSGWTGGTNLGTWDGSAYGNTGGSDASVGVGTALQTTAAATGNISVNHTDETNDAGISYSFAVTASTGSSFGDGQEEVATASESGTAERIIGRTQIESATASIDAGYAPAGSVPLEIAYRVSASSASITANGSLTATGLNAAAGSLITIHAGVGFNNDTYVSGITVDGNTVPGTNKVRVDAPDSLSTVEVWWYWTTTGAISNGNVVVSFFTSGLSGAGGSIIVCETTGASEATPVGNINTNLDNSGTSSVSVTRSTGGSIMVGAFLNWGGTDTAGTDTTILHSATDGAGDYVSAAYNDAGGTTVTLTHTSGAWGAAAIEINAAGGGQAPDQDSLALTASPDFQARFAISRAVPLAFDLGDNGRYLTRYGVPWQMRGENIWFANLNSNLAIWDDYLADRAARGYNAVVIMALVHSGYYSAQGWVDQPPKISTWVTGQDDQAHNYAGAHPWANAADLGDFSKLNETAAGYGYAYWYHLDRLIEAAYNAGFVIEIAPCYLGYGRYLPGNADCQGWFGYICDSGTSKYASNTQSAMYDYGAWLATRWSDWADQIIWMSDGDSTPVTSEARARVKAVRDGVRSVIPWAVWLAETDGADVSESGNQPAGTTTPSDYSPYDDDLTCESFYGYPAPSGNWFSTTAHRAFGQSKTATRPALPTEPRYACDVGTNIREFRHSMWHSLLGGGSAGVNESFYPGYAGPHDSSGSWWLNYFGNGYDDAREVMNEQLGWTDWKQLVPRTVDSGTGWSIDGPEIISSGVRAGRYRIFGATQDDGKRGIVYVPDNAAAQGAVTFSVDMTLFASDVHCWWIQPVSGAVTDIDIYPNTGTQSFTTPGGWTDPDSTSFGSSQTAYDWLLIFQVEAEQEQTESATASFAAAFTLQSTVLLDEQIETLTASDSQISRQAALGSVVETISATNGDSQVASQQEKSSDVETTIATDGDLATQAQKSQQPESTTPTEREVGQQASRSSESESSSASEVQVVRQVAIAAQTDSSSATESQKALTQGTSHEVDSATASETAQYTWSGAGGTEYTLAQSESATVSDPQVSRQKSRSFESHAAVPSETFQGYVFGKNVATESATANYAAEFTLARAFVSGLQVETATADFVVVEHTAIAARSQSETAEALDGWALSLISQAGRTHLESVTALATFAATLVSPGLLYESSGTRWVDVQESASQNAVVSSLADQPGNRDTGGKAQ